MPNLLTREFVMLKWLTAVLFAALLSGCGEKEYDFSLRHVRDIPLELPAKTFLGQPFDITYSDGVFYIPDRSTHQVLCFDSTGHLLRRIGTKGPGPGELLQPVSVAVLGDTLAVLEAGGRRLSLLTVRGEFLASFPISLGFPTGVELDRVHRSGFIISDGLGFNHYAFFDWDGTIRKKGQEAQTTAITLPVQLAGGSLSLTAGNEVLYSPVREYTVVKLNWQGDTLAVYAASPENYIPPALHSGDALRQQSMISLVTVPLAAGPYVVVQRIQKVMKQDVPPQLKNQSYFDVFSASGTLLKAGLPLPHSFFYSEGSLLYAIPSGATDADEPDYRIAVYELVATAK